MKKMNNQIHSAKIFLFCWLTFPIDSAIINRERCRIGKDDLIMRRFASIPDLISNEQLLALYPKLRGQKDDYGAHVQEWAKQAVIKGNMAQALYVAKLHNNSADQIGEALHQLVYSVEAIKNGAIDHHTEPNIRGYLTVAIHGRLRKHRIKDRLMWVDPATYKSLQRQGKDFTGIVTMPDIEKPSKGDISELLANQELLELTVFSDFEKELVAARLRNETDPKIAERLGVSKQYVHITRQRIQKRILEKLNGSRRMGSTL